MLHDLIGAVARPYVFVGQLDRWSSELRGVANKFTVEVLRELLAQQAELTVWIAIEAPCSPADLFRDGINDI